MSKRNALQLLKWRCYFKATQCTGQSAGSAIFQMETYIFPVSLNFSDGTGIVAQHRAQLQEKAPLGLGWVSRNSKCTASGHSDARVDFVNMKKKAKTSVGREASSLWYTERVFTCVCTAGFYLSVEWGASGEQA